MNKEEKEIKQYIRDLCKKYSTVPLTLVLERNEKIIRMVMQKYNISYDYAKECFLHNKESGN